MLWLLGIVNRVIVRKSLKGYLGGVSRKSKKGQHGEVVQLWQLGVRVLKKPKRMTWKNNLIVEEKVKKGSMVKWYCCERKMLSL